MSSVKPKVGRKKGTSKDKLTDKQQLFISHYLADNECNAAEAARKAGYTASAAGKLMNNPLVVAEISKAITVRKAELKLEANQVLQSLADIAFSNLRNYIKPNGQYKDLDEMTASEAAAIYSVNYDFITDKFGNVKGKTIVGYQFWDKMQALNMVARHLGMFNEQLKLKHDVTGLDTLISRLVKASDSDSTDNVVDAVSIEHLAKSPKTP